ncbi:amidohydrolase [Terribacillus saccharophilus]|uniref:Amidohydrolase n=1 Tax=Terribacillus saccharophilus TaxID=361277 RepID=A0A268ACY1_9BACI|nr:amidohydrolase [Terribacillus saccharophilus]PAD21982.1 amidohydrolase [Terribacillus saccharophilus]PAF22403.1 amidohydrolase [Terribacillus saccharophilus]PAF34986.1 amidohydrolase [Terribacillus saccharophilus]PAF38592.1 amidohydrolase [Terribacillus saccharophilus]
MSKKELVRNLEELEHVTGSLALDIWQHPQIAYKETYASTAQKDVLADAGFRITDNIGGMQTAFYAEYGSGHPTIGILGEFDALPGLSQSSKPYKDPVRDNAPGHACGHHLLGTAGVEAVLGLKQLIDQGKVNGTIRYYGCPAEEVLSGKTFMAREGVFDDLDCCLTWHPGTSNVVQNYSTQAMISIKFRFHGVPAHAAGAPHAGRSALDAVEIMNIGANYLREHLVDGTRIHYSITNGGQAPNIVPDEAEVWYYLRGENRDQVEDMLVRMHDIAKGAALITGTSTSHELLANCYHMLTNDTMDTLNYRNMEDYPMESFTSDEVAYAAILRKSMDPKLIEESRRQLQLDYNDILPTKNFYNITMKDTTMPGSTDVADVSWITPLASIGTTCGPIGTQVHAWQATAVFGTSIGLKGMHYAARIMALTAYDLLTEPALVEQAKAEFIRATADKPYQAGLDETVLAPGTERKEQLI